MTRPGPSPWQVAVRLNREVYDDPTHLSVEIRPATVTRGAWTRDEVVAGDRVCAVIMSWVVVQLRLTTTNGNDSIGCPGVKCPGHLAAFGVGQPGHEPEPEWSPSGEPMHSPPSIYVSVSAKPKGEPERMLAFVRAVVARVITDLQPAPNPPPARRDVDLGHGQGSPAEHQHQPTKRGAGTP